MNKEKLKKDIRRYEFLYKIHMDRLGRLLQAPFHTGTFFVMNAIAHIVPYQVRKKMPWGSVMSFFLPEANQIYYYDFWEINIGSLFIDILEEGDTFVDVGAHVGYYSSLAASLVGEEGRVIAIEPTPRTFASLYKNLSKIKQATAINAALGDRLSNVDFVDYGPRYSAFNSITERTGDDFKKKNSASQHITVPLYTLDAVLALFPSVPTLIKIDAEGAESMILQGATKTLNGSRPILTLEVGGDETWLESENTAKKILQEHHYIPFIALVDGKLTKDMSRAHPGYDNLIYIPTEKVEKYSHLIT